MINLNTNDGVLVAATVCLNDELDHDEMIRELNRDCRRLRNIVLTELDPTYKPKKKHNNRKIKIQDNETLYRIADAGLLDRLHGVNVVNGEKIYYFDRCKDVLDIISKAG